MNNQTTRPATELLLPADVGRIAGITSATVRALTARGRLIAAAMTPGGVHLYTRETAKQYAAERAARRRDLVRSGGADDLDVHLEAGRRTSPGGPGAA
jgi:hypothetical protein